MSWNFYHDPDVDFDKDIEIDIDVDLDFDSFVDVETYVDLDVDVYSDPHVDGNTASIAFEVEAVGIDTVTDITFTNLAIENTMSSTSGTAIAVVG
ncbi:hypothetical protein OCH239_18760 [Roseivivax halodurans JCM 10272]|uniref:Uncharacterized protein n=1 Tax=Roseivivax halodurans JCM 10272 TaxID=1449350 RepID=X7E7G4_9RHOB|nr:hypothetical protein [Roseivivax halodurans]ETX11994.1 hypothetical protein OCH239_18760 [Roseivivax halodurans JCM 10272]